jgi:hypothetical protein
VYEGPALDLKVLRFFPADARCLTAIDPIGNTVFNQIQIPWLAAELAAIIPSEKRQLPAAISALREFVESAIGKPHTYLIFIGD